MEEKIKLPSRPLGIKRKDFVFQFSQGKREDFLIFRASEVQKSFLKVIICFEKEKPRPVQKSIPEARTEVRDRHSLNDKEARERRSRQKETLNSSQKVGKEKINNCIS